MERGKNANFTRTFISRLNRRTYGAREFCSSQKTIECLTNKISLLKLHTTKTLFRSSKTSNISWKFNRKGSKVLFSVIKFIFSIIIYHTKYLGKIVQQFQGHACYLFVSQLKRNVWKKYLNNYSLWCRNCLVIISLVQKKKVEILTIRCNFPCIIKLPRKLFNCEPPKST